MSPATFQQKILTWFEIHGRKDLPWQQNPEPYQVWLSEIMLQQTQVSTVIPYFKAFINKFPDLDSLALASIDEVLHSWSGLGYYARARNLHKTAQLIVARKGFPETLQELMALPGIGRSTAGAILSIAFNKSQPILDGNVKRVLARYKAISGWTGSSLVNEQLWTISSELTPASRPAEYTQAMMDLGATICTRSKPACTACPLETHCLAKISGLTKSLPTPKLIKKLPVKEVVLLILSNHTEEILLEKRPPVGIWGGLWSLPEFDSIESAQNWCASKNISIVKQQIQKKQRHAFSHYYLDYTPLYIKINKDINIIMEENQTLWYNRQQIKILGLAAPIKRLLQQHTGDQNSD